MRVWTCNGSGGLALAERPRPQIQLATDAIVRISTTTICGSDLHILKGDVPVAAGTILGHEGVGTIEQVGSHVSCYHVGDRVLISSITYCGRCAFCRKAMYSHCLAGGWLLGNRIDGAQAPYVRIPFADACLHHLPPQIEDEAAVMLSCILPTGLECGALSGEVKPGDTVAIVGAGPVGLAVLLAAKLTSPTRIVMIDLDDNRLAIARAMGATEVVNSADGKAVERVMALTHDAGVDVAIEAVGQPSTFDLCQAIVAPGGRIANVGVHGRPVMLHLEKLWSSNVTLTTRLVDGASVPTLLRLVEAGRLDAKSLISHRFTLSDIVAAYDTFANASSRHALKVVLSNTGDCD